MPFKLACPNGHVMMIRDEHVGKRIKCPACGVGMLAEEAQPPAPPVAASEVVDYDPSRDPANEVAPQSHKTKPRRARPGKGRGRLPLVVILSAAGAVLAGLGVVLWLFVIGPAIEQVTFPLEFPQLPPSVGLVGMHGRVDEWRRRYGDREVLFICIKGMPDEALTAAMTRLKGPDFNGNMIGGRVGTTLRDREYTWVVMAPVSDAQTVADRVNFGRVVSVRGGRINVVADLSKFDIAP